jgi:hypothetical protein
MQEYMDNKNRRKIWLKEINDVILHEQMYLRVKVKDRQFD